ncbi:ABC transporter ATP-binding protein [Pseudomonas sp. TE3610]
MDRAPAVPSAPPLLSVQALTVRLPAGMERAHAVEHVSFDLNAGEILCIIGESGSGKSVTANTLMGLLPASIAVTHGQILFNGRNLLACDEPTLRGLRGQALSIIFQDPLSALNPLMTVAEQLMETLAAHGVNDPQEQQRRTLALLTEVGLPDPAQLRHQYPFRLSGGQRQRVIIAMALALDPQLLIADEPTTALDVTTQAQILDMIRALQRRKGMGVMFITHDFGVVAEIADRVVVMEKGRVVEQGPVEQVLHIPQHPYTRKLLAAVPRMARHNRENARQAPVVLSVRELCKTYVTPGRFFTKGRTVQAVNKVSFELREGRTLGIVGESGSGKSSLGRLLMKLMPSDSGSIHFDGHDICSLSQAAFRPLRRYIQMIFQDPFASLNPRHSIGKILTIGPHAHGVAYEKARTKALKLLKLVGLDASAFERYPHEFSGGQRQRIGIARALMFDPMVLIADEAVSALDVSIQAQIIELLATVQRETGVAMIFITHDLRIASRICDEVAVIHQGAIVETGAPHQVFNHPAHPYTQRLLAAVPRSDWAH